MHNKNTFVFAKITPKSEYFKSTKSELAGILEATRKEKGCIQFELHESECGCYLYLYEEWLNKKSLENHHTQTHTMAAAKKIESWLSQPTEVLFMKKLNQVNKPDRNEERS